MTHDLADACMAEYLLLRDDRYAIPGAALDLTGSTSTCCGAETFARSGRLLCWKCRRQTKPKAAAKPQGRGGWNPGHRQTWNRIMVSATRVVDRGSEDRRRAGQWDRYRTKEAVIEMCPRDYSPREWWIRLIAWEGALHPHVPGYAAVAGLSRRYHAQHPELATEESVRNLVRDARRVVSGRLRYGPARSAREIRSRVGGAL